MADQTDANLRAEFERIRGRAANLRTLYGARDTLYEELRQMVHMEWSDPPTGDWIKATMSPSAYNALMGAVRLMVSTEPQINVPFDEAQAQAKQASGKIEQACKAMWAGSGRVAQRPVHYEAVFSALMFAEICGSVTRTADLLKQAEATKNKVLVARMQHVAARTPYFFQVYSPATCYGDIDAFGLRGMLRRTAVTWGEVVATWGQAAEDAAGAKALTWRTYDQVTLNDWYDWQYRAVWLEDTSEWVWFDEHGLDFLPVVDQIVDGTMLFARPELQRFPMLYAMAKSGLWKRENLGLTTVYSLIHALGSNPLMVQETDDQEAPTTVDRTTPGGIMKVPKGERPSALLEKVVDPEQYKGLELAARLNEESTIPKMALGAPPQQVMAFSAISLLVQAGRLPLTATKQLGGEAIANLLLAALAWYKADPPVGGASTGSAGSGFYDYGKGREIELSPADIPERLALRVSLEPDLPTDKLQLAQIGQALVRDGLASTRWVRENILMMGQSEAMDKEISDEKRLVFEIQRLFQQLSAQDQLKVQQAAQAMQAQAEQAALRHGEQESNRQGAAAAPPTQMGPGMQGPPQGGPEMGGPSTGSGSGGGGPAVSPYPPGGEVTEGRPLTGPLPARGQAR
jgi:hypothetical protein